MRFLAGFLRAVWRGLDALRRVLHLLLLLALAALVIGVLVRPGPHLPQTAALVVRPSGRIVEQLSGAPLQQALAGLQGSGRPQTLLWNLVTAIRAAAGDPHIKALLIDTDDMTGAGQADLEELADAIRVFRRSGKPVIAEGEYFLQSQYYLAAQANDVYLDPLGFVLLDGYGRYSLYFKTLLKTLGVNVHVFRVGQYKSAVEPFTRTNMSAQDRAQSVAYLQALWNAYLQEVARARGLTVTTLENYADNLPAEMSSANGDAAKVAKQAGLITGLETATQVRRRMMRLVGTDPSGTSFPQISVRDYLRATHARQAVYGSGPPQIGVIIASGDILGGAQPPGAIGGESTAALLRAAARTRSIRALVLRVDSPGGSVLASEQIYRAVRAVQRAGKPVVVSMSDLAASGGYYISSPANLIIASPATLTGSIGVFAAVPTFNGTLKKIGVGADGVGTTPLSGALQLGQPMSPAVSTLLQQEVDHSYAVFVQHVAAGRHKTQAYVRSIGQGHVWAGRAAQRIGLVDQIGSYEDALRAAAKLAGLKGRYVVRRIQPRRSWLQRLLLQAQTEGLRLLERSGLMSEGDSAGLGRLASMPPARGLLQRLLARPGQVESYCFCRTD